MYGARVEGGNPVINEIHRRPLRLNLNKDDIIFFQHLPKTGGVSLIAFLDSQFAPEEIFPMHSTRDKTQFAEYTPEQAKRLRLIRGHFRFGPYDDGIYRYITQNPIRITFLREPVARTISAYRHQLRTDKAESGTTLEKFLTKPEYAKHVADTQTRLIVGKIKANTGDWIDEKPLPDSVLIQLAKENLEYMAFVGLTERFKPSMQMLCHTFGWQMPQDIPQLNSSPEPFDTSALPPSTLKLIHEKTRLDAELYQFAIGLFEQRYAQMVDELVEENYRLRTSNVKVEISPLTTSLLPPEPPLPPWSRKMIRSVRRRLFPRGTQREMLYVRMRNTVFKRPQL